MPEASTYVLRVAGRAPVHLRQGESVRIGRHSSNELALDDGKVSRFHARVFWPPATPRAFVEDRGSQNGTLLDGIPVHGAVPLTERATLTVGDLLISVELRDPALIVEDAPLTCRLLGDGARKDEEGLLVPSRTLRDLLLDLERQSRTGTLLLAAPRTRARLTFAAGQIIDASTDTGRGQPALEEALEMCQRARFTFRADIEPGERTLRVSPRAMLADDVRSTTRLDPARWGTPVARRRLG